MASGRLFLPGWMPARDSNGDPIPNVSVSFYENETDDLASVYADDALTIPLTNPVAANSSGRFPQIYASDAITYSASVDAPYGPAGQPFTFDGLQASQAADIAAANLAQGAAEDAEVALQSTLDAIEFATEVGGGAAALAGALAGTAAANIVVAGKANINGDNTTASTFRTNIETAARNVAGPGTAVQGSVAAIDYMFGQDASSSGGIHPNGKVYYGYSFKKTFTAAGNPTPAAAPAFTVLSYAEVNGAQGDVGAYMGEVVCTAANTKGLGMNLIVGSDGAYANLKQEGLEIDIQPVAGSTVIDGFGLALNAFNAAMPISSILIGGVAGGSFANGINIIGGVSEAGLVATNNPTLKSLVNSGAATYTDDAFVLTQGDRLRFSGTAAAFGLIWMDGSNNLRYVCGSSGNHIFRNNSDTVSLAAVTPNGLDVQVAGGSLRIGGTDVVKTRDTGWTAATGSPFKGAYASYTSVIITNPPTQAEVQAIANALQNLSQRYVALDAALRQHGLIGT